MLSDPIHHLLVIFHGNIDEYFHGLGPVSLPYAIASGFLTNGLTILVFLQSIFLVRRARTE